MGGSSVALLGGEGGGTVFGPQASLQAFNGRLGPQSGASQRALLSG